MEFYGAASPLVSSWLFSLSAHLAQRSVSWWTIGTGQTSRGAYGPDGSSSLALGLVAEDGPRSLEVLLFSIIDGRDGGPQFVTVR